MQITFPHMGNVHIPIKTLLQKLQLEAVPPPPITQKTLALGIKYAPEFACLPLKISIGNFIEALENGADTILMAGGWGPCRFGYYAQVERDILQDLGYQFKMIILEAPDSNVRELLNQVKAMGENVTLWETLKVVKYVWHQINAIDKLEKAYEYHLAHTSEKERADKIFGNGLAAIGNCCFKKDIDQVCSETIAGLENLPRHNQPVLKIGLVGEVYTVLEPACNFDIISFLGHMNAAVTRSIYLPDWINDHLFKGMIKKSNRAQVYRQASPYLNYWVGGHGRETVGCTVGFARSAFDGVIQVGPLTCMPEIVAQSVLQKVSEEESIPCMTLYFDEHSGSAGVYTRLEAFTDMLNRRVNTGLSIKQGRLN
ncbi:MAG: acyl-CoA dehydratase activase-related protein [Syntrophomonadaceae bacterium]|nr:acyl-CoA dehydratase activase-related protein [Syntrophomonadaceae bacterium]